MRLKSSGLLTLLISLFILNSCENPTGVGLDVDPDFILNSKVIDTSTVYTKLIKEDSIITQYTERSVLAYMKDNEFGETTANIILAPTLPASNTSFGTNPILDSAVLVLNYASTGALYGDSALYRVNIHRLTETVYKDNPKEYFYSNKVWNFDNTLISSKDFYPAYGDSVSINLHGYQDSVVKVVPQLRIPLDNSFITQHILDLDSATLSTNQKFADYFKGLRLSIDKASSPANGGAIAFDTYTSGATRLDIYYRYTNSEGELDTTSVSFPVTGNYGSAVTEIAWDKTGTPVEAELNNTTNNNSKLYLKALAGTKLKLRFPYLDSLKKLGKSISINRAELIFTAEEPQQSVFLPLSQLRIFRWDLAHQPKPLPDEDPADPRNMGQGFIGGVYNKTKKVYVINVTGYIQDLFRKKTINYSTFISTISSHYLNNGNPQLNLNPVGRAIFEGGGSTSPDKVKLKIYYSDLK